jgi:Ca2+-binding RTX toxin-like protein
MAAGFLAAAGFRSAAGATSALTSTQRVIHNASTGDLYYDSDGAGGAASVRFANIGAGQPVFYYDFFGI